MDANNQYIMNILLVEDDAGLVELITEKLEESGFSVKSATSGAEALAHLDKQTPDLMLLDYSLPDINGKELIETLIKQQTPLPPFIITTGQGDERIAVDMMKLGTMDYVIKDILFLEKLPDVVKRAIKEIESDDKLKQYEEVLKENEVRFRAFMNASNNPTFIKDDHFRYLFANEQMARFFNRSTAEIIGKTDAELTERTQISICQSSDKRALESNEQFTIEEQLGSCIFEVTKLPLQLPNNKRGIGGIMKDITERKQKEDDLLRSEERFRTLYTDTPALLHSIDNEGIIQSVSKRWLEKIGYEQDEVIGHKSTEFLTKKSRQSATEQYLPKFFKEGFIDNVPYQYLTKAGDVLDILLSAISEKDENGNIILSLAVLEDITERKIHELQLRESEKKYRNLVNLAQEGIWVIDKNSITSFANPSMAKMLGYSPEEMIGKSLFDFMDETGVKIANENLEHRKAGLKEQHDFEFICKNGDRIFCTMTTAPIIDETGNYQGAIAGVIDISERKKAEGTLTKEKKIFEDLFNNVNSGVAIYKVINDGKFGKDYIIEKFNIKALELEGKTSEEVVGKSLYDLRPDIDNYGLVPELREVWKTGIGRIYPSKIYIDENFSNYYENRIFSLPDKKVVAIYDDVTKKKQAEEKIRAAEQNLKNTFDISPSIICKANVETGYFVEVNQAVTRILGYSIDEFTSKSIIEFIHPDDRQRTADEITEQMHGNKTTFFENRYLCKDGSYKWMAWNATKADKNGIVTAIASDISERKIIEQEIIETKQFYENIIEGVQDGIWVTDKNDVIFYANSAMEKIAGVPREQIQGNNVLKDFPKETTGELIKFYKQAKKEKKPIWYDIRVRTLSNKDSWQNGWLIPQYQNNVFTGIICTIRDVTERKEAEGSVRKLSTAVEQSPSVVVITDTEGIVEYVNPTFTKLTGYSSAEAIGQKSNILKSGEQDSEFYKEMWKIVDSGKVWRGQFHNKKKNKELFWEAASISAIKNESGDVINYIKIGEDITQQKIAETELKAALEKALESDRLKSAFLSNMSHEIRTPMNGILGFINLLNEPNLTKSQIGQYSAIINKSGDRLLNTINDIIDISRIEAGEVVVSTTETSLNDELNELYSFHSPEAKLKGLSFLLIPCTENLTISTDSHKLHGILTNLIKNAIKYTEKGSITFGYFLKKNFIEFYVKDSGIGIPKNRMEAIFNRFEQADIEDTRVFEGSGLGLAISKAYIEMLGGEIFVESEEGIGSTFTFKLPYTKKRTEEIEQQPENFNKETASMKNLNLLVVEDDEVSSELLETIFIDTFQKITFVENGIEAIELCKKNPEIDLVLMDIKMPGMNGYEATREIRKFDKDLIIIAQTAYAMFGDKEKAIEAGCNDYISKPINKILLLKIINKLFYS